MAVKKYLETLFTKKDAAESGEPTSHEVIFTQQGGVGDNINEPVPWYLNADELREAKEVLTNYLLHVPEYVIRGSTIVTPGLANRYVEAGESILCCLFDEEDISAFLSMMAMFDVDIKGYSPEVDKQVTFYTERSNEHIEKHFSAQKNASHMARAPHVLAWFTPKDAGEKVVINRPHLTVDATMLNLFITP